MKQMTIQELTKITKANTNSNTRVLRIPMRLYSDSAFPFVETDILEISILHDTLTITKKAD